MVQGVIWPLMHELEGMLETWKLPAIKLSATTTDNAANIVLAMEILGWEHFRCFSHSLQLAINQAFDIPQVSRALARTQFGHSLSLFSQVNSPA